MKYIHDLVSRFGKLQELADDPNVVNEDGSRVDPYVELAAEILEVPKSKVSFESRNEVIRLVNVRLQRDIRSQTKHDDYADAMKYAAAWHRYHK